jgi:hypothetical protein
MSLPGGRNPARERRLARRMARKVCKSGEKLGPEVFEAYLAGLQRGLELQEQRAIKVPHCAMQDIFGNEIVFNQRAEAQPREAELTEAAPPVALVLH